MDNFECIHGQKGYFGLYECNFETGERTLRKAHFCTPKNVKINPT